MEKIQQYEIIEKIRETTSSLVYRGRKENDKNTVIVKIIKAPSLSQAAIANFKKEYNIIRGLDIKGIVNLHEMFSYEGRFILVLEDFDGFSLERVLNEKKIFDIRQFLKTGIKISEAIGELHKRNVIHKNIKPSNILINRDYDTVKITDFGIFSLLVGGNEGINNPDLIQEMLYYLSPEQTGRMNRMVDYRTDMYSLGVTFYKMLTGTIPFESKDPMEVIHAHIAKQPIPPNELKANIPGIVSDIILKLMSKDADDRYQNAFGIAADLEECLGRLDAEGRIKPFELAGHDISSRFIMPQKLLGREMELDILMSGFDRISGSSYDPRRSYHDPDSGSTEVALVIGVPGIGKSELVNEFGKLVIEKKGYFLSGKYEQFRGDTPYSAIINAFQKLFRQILTDSDEKIKSIKGNILEALGPNAKIITDIIPELELIIGKQAEVAKLAPNEARNRFNMVFEKFVDVFTKKEHPITLFLDNLQWADQASLKLIRNIITSPKIQYFFVIGSYRDNEIYPAHPLMEILEDIEKSGRKIIRITLTEITVGNIKDLIINVVKCSEERAFQLAELIYRKTGGNPFFIREFLQTLYKEKLIEIDTMHGWTWDIEKIKEISITDNVVELLSHMIKRLPQATQDLLKKCACIGNKFDLETILSLLEKSIDETFSILAKAIEEGFIYETGNVYAFNHERIQETAYSLLNESEKSSIHYRIGRISLQKYTDNYQDKLFYITDQLNLGSSLITDEKEKEELARLNLDSGIKSKKSTAYSHALKYFEFAISLLEEKCWETQYDLSLAVYCEAAETAYLKGDYDAVNRYASIVIDSARNVYDTMPVYETEIHAYDAQSNFTKSIEIAFNVLKKLNFPILERPGRLRVKTALLKTKLNLSAKKIDSLIDLPEMTDPHMLAVSQILFLLETSALNTFPDLFTYITIKRFEISIKYGISQTQTIVIIGMAHIFTGVFGDIERGYRLGKLALMLVKKFNAQGSEAATLFLYNLIIAHWKEHLNSIRPELMKSYSIGMQTGAFIWTAYSIFLYDAMGLNLGIELTELEKEMAGNYNLIEQLKQIPILYLHSIFWQMALNLLGRNESPMKLRGTALDEDRMVPMWEAFKIRLVLGTYYNQRLILRYLFYDYQGAIADSNILIGYLKGLTGGLAKHDYNFYSSLARLAVYPTASKREKREYKKYVNQSLKRFRKWAAYAPMNNEHHIQIIEAEKSRVLGRHADAEYAYDKAVELSKKYKYLIEEAIANELAGMYYISRGRQKLAQLYLQDAYTCYARWGAAAKLKQLKQNFADFFMPIGGTSIAVPDSSDVSASVAASQIIDVETVIKASQIISGEVALGKLLTKMIKIAIENAGARKGFMMLENNGRYLVEAEGTIENQEIKVLESIPVDVHEGLSSSIVNYVVRTSEMLILNDASNEGDFIHDMYVLKNKPKSILCAPIINHGKLIGIIYLENNLSIGAFIKDRLKILNILSSQMAISIDNAKFYEKLEKKVRERTKELEESEKRFKDIMFSSADWIWEVDKKGVYQYCSQKVEVIMGYKPEELIGKTTFDLMRKDEVNKFRELYMQISKNREPIKDIENWHISKDGKQICILTNGVPIFDDRGKFTGYRGVDKDITERKQAEMKMQDLMKDLSRSNHELEQFAYIVSHDLQEPLRKIMIFGDKLKGGKTDKNNEKNIDYMERMQDAAKRMQDLIRGLLDYSRVTTMKQPFVPVDLGKVINDAVSDLEARIRDTGGRVEVEEMPLIKADALQMRQLFQNLIGNALKFHRQGEQPLVKVYSSKAETEDYCRIIVQDNGIGIDKKDHEKIFGVFQRLHGKSEYEGSGIGLAVCKKIVERHEGKVEVESEINIGTKFIVTLPVRNN